MKKFILLALAFAVAGFFAYKLLSDKPAAPAGPPPAALHVGKASSQFNTAFADVLTQYYALKDALVDWDTLKADQAAYALSAKVDSLPVRTLQADSDIVKTALSLNASLSSEAKAFTGEAGIENRRRAFNMLTDELYNLVMTVNYDGEKIYHIKCPMAFKETEEGYWLSNTPQVVNPYLGNKHPKFKSSMLSCGEVMDSLPLVRK
ncbi:MAG: DUF3347 domain-containing protein [Bacteroidetes bacterium]|nr:DUF3347 domain-containing protein [Bacteroidota bacterium]